jgi:YbbR domain-containing protein
VKRIGQTLLRVVTNNFGWKLAAIGIAVLIWVVVASEPELASFAAVSLQYKNLPSDLEISSSLIETVYLELRGPSGELRTLNTQRPAVVLDMTGVTPGERTFALGDREVRVPRGVHLVRAIPSQVRFDFEKRAVREVPVRARFNLDRQPEYEVASYTVSPAQLAVEGPESRVARITTAVSDPIDLAGVIGQTEFRVNAFVEDSYVRFRSSPAVVVSVTMKKKQK